MLKMGKLVVKLPLSTEISSSEVGVVYIYHRRQRVKVRSPVADEIWSAKFELGLNLMNFDVFRFGNGTAMPLDEA